MLLKEDEAEEMLGSVKSLRSNLWFLIEDANALREHELYWTHSRTGLSLRCKLDLLATYKDDLVIPDLKTCADNERFPDQVKRSKLWLQVAHYRAGVKHHYQREALFWFAVVEKSPPFKVWHYMLDEYALKLADEKYEALLDELKRRIDDNDWAEPGEDGIQLTVKDCFGWEG